MNSSSFTVCTYNMSCSYRDYYNQYKHLNPNHELENDTTDFEAKYLHVQSVTAKLLLNQADIYCLQEVVNEDRPLIRSLKENNFEIVHYRSPDGFDSVVALNRAHFSDITSDSFVISKSIGNSKRKEIKDVAVAQATDNQTQQRITFVSVHLQGFEFANTGKKLYNDAAIGDAFSKELIAKLSQIGKDSINIIGADMNANPEIWRPRFEYFAHHDFQVVRSNEPTNVFPFAALHREREIDFVFVKENSSKNPFHVFKKQFAQTVKVDAQFMPFTGFGWDAEKNASDHLPVFSRVTIKVNKPKIPKHYAYAATIGVVASLSILIFLRLKSR